MPARDQHIWAETNPAYNQVVTIASIEELLPRPSVMGILNVTPDSFWDGGRYLAPADALERARTMVLEGARIVDLGGESTRPGAAAVGLDEELRRVVPVLERLAAAGIPVSIDTSKAEVARRALALGAVMINDVTALRADPDIAEAVAASEACLCLMHMRGVPATMQDDPRYEDVVSEVSAFLEERLAFAVRAGIPEGRICLDPGIGFGKTASHNLELLSRLDEIVALGRPVLVGASRKRFLARILGEQAAITGSLAAGVAVAVLAFERGAAIFRVHDVREHVDALGAARAFETIGAES
jgi:dihydropteroate synthase